MPVTSPHIQSTASDSITGPSLERWRAFLAELAAVGAHVAVMTHDNVEIAFPPERKLEVMDICNRHALASSSAACGAATRASPTPHTSTSSGPRSARLQGFKCSNSRKN